MPYRFRRSERPCRCGRDSAPPPRVHHFVDIMATCVDAGNATYPARAGDQEIIPMQGRSLLPLISRSVRSYDRSIFWEHEGNRAMRHGPWKLVRKFPGEWELYNIHDDRTELRNLVPSRAPLV